MRLLREVPPFAACFVVAGAGLRAGQAQPAWLEDPAIRHSESNIPTAMLRYAIIFIVIALVAGVLGFASLEGLAATIAKVCFVLFLIFAVISFVRKA